MFKTFSFRKSFGTCFFFDKISNYTFVFSQIMIAFINCEWYSLDNITSIRLIVILTVLGGSYMNPLFRNASLKVRNCQIRQSRTKSCPIRGNARVNYLLEEIPNQNKTLSENVSDRSNPAQRFSKHFFLR